MSSRRCSNRVKSSSLEFLLGGQARLMTRTKIAFRFIITLNVARARAAAAATTIDVVGAAAAANYDISSRRSSSIAHSLLFFDRDGWMNVSIGRADGIPCISILLSGVASQYCDSANIPQQRSEA